MNLTRSLIGRRQFLIAAGAASTSALAFKKIEAVFNEDVSMASENSGAGVAKSISNEKYSKTIKTDVVVLGSGAGGMTAAIIAKQQGVKNVIILEKRSEIGGNSVFAPVPILDEGTSEEELFNIANENTHWRGDARIIGTMINRARGISDWLKGFAEDVQVGEYDGRLVKILKEQCDKLGIQILCNTRAVKLLRGEDNFVVVGVSAEQDGKPIKVDATVTVLATGGFLGDPEFMARYFQIYDDKFSDEVNMEGLLYSGDGIKMALEVGAGNDGTVSFEWSPNRVPFFKGDLKKFPVISLLTDNIKTPMLWVNNVGVRFTNESKRLAINAIYRQPNRDCFILLDEGIVEHMAKKYPNLVSLEKLQKEITTFIDADQALVTDSVGAIAAWIRGKKHILQNGINGHNRSCEEGYDESYYKDPAFLIPLSKPPFYVFRSGLSLRTTHGPIKVSGMGSVVAQYDWPIPALMACGADIGGLHADLLISSEDSHSIEWTIASGMCAGGNAAAYVNGNRPVQVYEFPKYSAKDVMAGHYENVGTIDVDAAGPGGGPPPSDDNKSYH